MSAPTPQYGLRNPVVRGLLALVAVGWATVVLIAWRASLPELETIPDPRSDGSVPDERNMVAGLLAAVEGFPDRTKEPEKYEQARDAAMPKIKEALARPEIAMPRPTPENQYGTFDEDLEAALSLVRRRLRWDMGRYRRGDEQAALDDILDYLDDLAAMVDAGGATTAYAEVADAECYVYRCLASALRGRSGATKPDVADPTVACPTDEWPAERAQRWRRVLERLVAGPAGEPEAIQHAIQADYHWRKEAFEDLSRIGDAPPPTPVYSPQMTIEWSRDAAQRYVEQAALEPWQREPDALEPWRTGGVGQYLWNPYGRMQLEDAVGWWQWATDAHDHRLAHNRLVTGCVALKLYLEQHGQLPADWRPLVDEGLLPAVPIDPYDGRPLRYRPAEGLIYSVAKNGVDDGGENDATTGQDDARERLWLVPTPTSPDDRDDAESGEEVE